jgi:hypothetical protein
MRSEHGSGVAAIRQYNALGSAKTRAPARTGLGERNV